MYPLHVLADGRLGSSLDAMTTDAVVAAGGGLATARSWTGGATPMVLAASLALLMALVSLVRGVRAFSFGLTWWGKHGRLRLRVESYATLAEAGQGGLGVAGGGSISGIFCAELMEGGEGEAGDGEGVAGELRLLDEDDEEEDEDEGEAKEKEVIGVEDGCGANLLLQTKRKQSRRVVGGSAEMGFYFYHKTHHHDYASPPLSLASLSALDYCSGAGCCDYSQLDLKCGWPNSVLHQEVEEDQAEQQLVVEEKQEEQQQQEEEEAAEEDSGVRRPHPPFQTQCAAMHGIQSRACTFTMPDWACSLLEPLQISAAFSSRRTSVAPSNRKCVKLKKPDPDFPLLRLQLTAEVFRGRRRPRHRGGILAAAKSHVVLRGDKLTATSRDDVVRIWERRRGRGLPVETLYLPPGDSVASMDVDWAAGVAAVGTAGGLLSLWDLERAVSAGTAAAHRGQVGALHLVPGTAAGTLSLTGGPAEVGGKAVSAAVSVWDSRLLAAAEGASTTTGSSSSVAAVAGGTDLGVVQGLRAQGPQIFVRDAQGCISGLDLRKLVSVPIDTVPAELVAHHCAQQLPSSSSSSASLSPPPVASSAGGGRLGTERSRRSQDSLLLIKESSSGRASAAAAAAAAARSEESRWWEKEIGYGSEEDDEEDGWPNGILCAYPTEASGKPSWIGRLIGEIKTQLHLGGQQS